MIGEKKKILIVDDEIDILSQLNSALFQEGFHCITANGGMMAIAQFNEFHPAICVVDYKMPGMDGLELMRRLKEIDPQTEIILVSGHADMRIAVTAIKEHAFDFIPKPIDLDYFINKIFEISSHIDRVKVEEGSAGSVLYHKGIEGIVPYSEVSVYVDLDEAGSPKFRKELDYFALKGFLKRNVLMEMGRVQRINNIGLNTLVETYDKYTKNDHTVVLRNLSVSVFNYLHMLGYDQYFRVIKPHENPESLFLK